MDIENLLNLDLPEDNIQALRAMSVNPVYIEAHNADVLNRLIRFGLADEGISNSNGVCRPGAVLSVSGRDYLDLIDAKERSQRQARSRSFGRDIAFLFLGGGGTWLLDHADATTFLLISSSGYTSQPRS